MSGKPVLLVGNKGEIFVLLCVAYNIYGAFQDGLAQQGRTNSDMFSKSLMLHTFSE